MIFRLRLLTFLLAGLLGLAGCAAAASSALPTATAVTLPVAAVTATKVPTVTPLPVATATTTPTAAPTVTPSATPAAIRQVVLITIDGLRPDALAAANAPNLAALRQAGAFSAAAKAVLPSVTLVNHASILGGMSPAKHGITWNDDKHPADAIITGPTLFSVAHEAGLSTAMVVGKKKFSHLVIPGTVDQYVYAGYLDAQVAGKAIDIINAGLPNVLFIHLPNVDSAGHLTGWMSAGQLLAVAGADTEIGKIVAALKTNNYWDNTLLLITADHGGSDKAHGSASPEDTTVPWLAVGPGVPAGKTLRTPIVAYDTAATVLFALKLPIPPGWDGKPVREIFK